MAGTERRKAQFYGLHHAGQIEVQAYHPQTRRLVKVAFGDYADIDFQTHELVCSDPDPWSSYRRAQARFVQLPMTVNLQRIDLFSEILGQWPSHVRLNVPQALPRYGSFTLRRRSCSSRPLMATRTASHVNCGASSRKRVKRTTK